MNRKVRVVSVLLVLGVILALTEQVASDTRAAFAGADVATASYSLDAAVWQLIPANKLEDGVAPELTVDVEMHRGVLAGNIGNRALNPPIGSYTGRNCLAVYRCPH